MKDNVDIIPIRIKDGEADYPKALALAQAYCKKTWGDDAPNLSQLQRVYAVIEQNGDAEQRCIGLIGLTQRVDVPVCHVDEEAHRPALIRRAQQYLMDGGFMGKTVLLFVDPEVERFIRERYLEKMGAQPANRWLVPIVPKVGGW